MTAPAHVCNTCRFYRPCPPLQPDRTPEEYAEYGARVAPPGRCHRHAPRPVSIPPESDEAGFPRRLAVAKAIRASLDSEERIAYARALESCPEALAALSRADEAADRALDRALDILAGHQTVWPRVRMFDTCGEWREAKDTRP